MRPPRTATAVAVELPASAVNTAPPRSMSSAACGAAVWPYAASERKQPSATIEHASGGFVVRIFALPDVCRSAAVRAREHDALRRGTVVQRPRDLRAVGAQRSRESILRHRRRQRQRAAFVVY